MTFSHYYDVSLTFFWLTLYITWWTTVKHLAKINQFMYKSHCNIKLVLRVLVKMLGYFRAIADMQRPVLYSCLWLLPVHLPSETTSLSRMPGHQQFHQNTWKCASDKRTPSIKEYFAWFAEVSKWEGVRESMVDCLRDQLIPPASLLVSRRGFSRWDPAGHADNQPWIYLSHPWIIYSKYIYFIQ